MRLVSFSQPRIEKLDSTVGFGARVLELGMPHGMPNHTQMHAMVCQTMRKMCKYQKMNVKTVHRALYHKSWQGLASNGSKYNPYVETFKLEEFFRTNILPAGVSPERLLYRPEIRINTIPKYPPPKFVCEGTSEVRTYRARTKLACRREKTRARWHATGACRVGMPS